jgi:hypothetical protein
MVVYAEVHTLRALVSIEAMWRHNAPQTLRWFTVLSSSISIKREVIDTMGPLRTVTKHVEVSIFTILICFS